ncbi:hypothetical protein MKEN_01473500 [Mycena kentingensis (nom. inval.)]|nr:hypothetical protein MKEN_01473500 [Mycena kentingensis (nom. inval.)]
MLVDACAWFPPVRLADEDELRINCCCVSSQETLGYMYTVDNRVLSELSSPDCLCAVSARCLHSREGGRLPTFSCAFIDTCYNSRSPSADARRRLIHHKEAQIYSEFVVSGFAARRTHAARHLGPFALSSEQANPRSSSRSSVTHMGAIYNGLKWTKAACPGLWSKTVARLSITK